MEDQPAESLLVTEVRTPAAHWSSYPPHKHDVDDPPRETLLEETYYHRIRPAGGFCFQRVYTDDRSLDESIAVVDGDVVLVPRGYHPVAAGARHDSYYLNVMAGPVREWHVTTDAAFVT
jgi:5-deoxy-glucuronate isomerase